MSSLALSLLEFAALAGILALWFYRGNQSVREHLAIELGLGLMILYIFTESSRGASETGASWFRMGLIGGGAGIGGVLGFMQIRFYLRRLQSNIITLKRDHIGQVFTPEIVGIICLFFLWGGLAAFAVPREAFGHRSLFINAHRFVEGTLPAAWVISASLQLVWAGYLQKQRNAVLMFRTVSTSNNS